MGDDEGGGGVPLSSDDGPEEMGEAIDDSAGEEGVGVGDCGEDVCVSGRESEGGALPGDAGFLGEGTTDGTAGEKSIGNRGEDVCVSGREPDGGALSDDPGLSCTSLSIGDGASGIFISYLYRIEAAER